MWLFATEFLFLLQLKPIQIRCWRQSGTKTPFAREVSLMVNHLPIKLPPFPLIGMTSFLFVFVLNKEVVSILSRSEGPCVHFHVLLWKSQTHSSDQKRLINPGTHPQLPHSPHLCHSVFILTVIYLPPPPQLSWFTYTSFWFWGKMYRPQNAQILTLHFWKIDIPV